MSTIQGGHLAEVQAAYREERAAARGASPFWLRWRWRQFLRQTSKLDDRRRARLKALRDEFDARGLELPG